MPDYKLRLWDGNSFDFDSVPFVRDAIAARKWAFAADYVRLYALYTEGGIYLDSDVEVFKRFDAFLENSYFTGTEPYIDYLGDKTLKYAIEGAIMGGEKGHPLLKDCLEYYQNATFSTDKNPTICQVMIPLLAKYGYRTVNDVQKLGEGITVYPTEYQGEQYCFYGHSAIHWAQGSWLKDKPQRGKLYYFCQRNKLMGVYRMLEKITKSLKR